MAPNLRCEIEDLPSLAKRYQNENPGEDDELLGFRESIRERGYMTKDELRVLARWKSARILPRIELNEEEYVQEITRFCFKAETERARIELLTLLDGVQWATASVILHFFHQDPYPILDFRALWATSIDMPNQYSFAFWWNYVTYCREKAQQASLDMRPLDQALWQFSKENQTSNDDGLTALRESCAQAETGQTEPIDEAFAEIREKLKEKLSQPKSTD